ncbi:MAG TPA: iron-sulfur cluster insertion protein ErpA [Gammaproteobacteria bacterium]|nr:iron-sulfur cluster insertion protein ErpA [Gammaproteobacteria bacterium]
MTTQPASPINVTQQAVEKIHNLAQEETHPDKTMFQIYVKGGGCHGFQYGLQFQNNSRQGDQIFCCKGEHDTSVNIIIDMISLQYLTGASLDYKQDAMGEQFIIKNPNAKTTCGCGNSFSTK